MAIAIYLLTNGSKGQSSMKLQRDLGVTQRMAWFLAHRIRDAWSAGRGAFSGTVEVDETYIGGKRKMPKHERESLAGRGGQGIRCGGIEAFWSVLKRGQIGTYDKMSVKRLHRHGNAFSGRQNVRLSNTLHLLCFIVTNMTGGRLRYKELTA